MLGTHAIAGNQGGTNVASGSFIFGDRSTNVDLLSLGPNEFLMRVAGGVRIYTSANLGSGVTVAAGGGSWSSLSDLHAKENFRDLDGPDVLARLVRLPIREWNYKTQDATIRHVGPTAQDFQAAFGLGESDTRISTVDVDGIALRAIQALAARLQAADERARVLEAEVAALHERLTRLEALSRDKR